MIVTIGIVAFLLMLLVERIEQKEKKMFEDMPYEEWLKLYKQGKHPDLSGKRRGGW